MLGMLRRTHIHTEGRTHRHFSMRKTLHSIMQSVVRLFCLYDKNYKIYGTNFITKKIEVMGATIK